MRGFKEEEFHEGTRRVARIQEVQQRIRIYFITPPWHQVFVRRMQHAWVGIDEQGLVEFRIRKRGAGPDIELVIQLLHAVHQQRTLPGVHEIFPVGTVQPVEHAEQSFTRAVA